ncbi:hypothetical protein FDECE_9373, partial [Fusarium decemcellulare]
LDDFERKVNAVCTFHPDEQPTNLVDHMEPKEVKFRMNLHRDLVRGTGFYDTLIRGTSADRHHSCSGDSSVPTGPRSLPVVSLLDTDEDRIKSLMQEALPDDRARFYNYLHERPLGLGIITAGAGFGKTTALAVGTIGMTYTLGKIYATAPTHVAVDNFAERLDLVDESVTDRLNQSKSDNDTDRAHYRHVVRGYKVSSELHAFMHLLQHPNDGDKAAPNSGWHSQLRWRKHLSAAFWLLVLLRSPETRGLRSDDSVALHQMRDRIGNDEHLQRLRAVVAHDIDYIEYERGAMVSKEKLTALLEEVINAADIVCTTPALSTKAPYARWKYTAKGIAVDEAGCISRPDLYCVWGNTLLPCLMAGDDKQLPPTVMSLNDIDAMGNFVNRLGLHGKMSPLLFFKGMGWPIYRLHTQLRMAIGMFGPCHSEIYSDLPLQYGSGSDISLPQHSAGRELEEYLQQKYPELTPPTPGTLQPAFIHCKDTFCFINPITLSRSNAKQNKVALAFLSDFVESSNVDPASIMIISPYKSNVDVINRMRKRPQYAPIAAMKDAVTIDSFQGQECDIAVVVMVATQQSGPGFTGDPQRLNVMFSRQKSGLLVFGDIDAPGSNKRKRGVTYHNGKASFFRATALKNMFQAMLDSGRVIRVEAEKETTVSSAPVVEPMDTTPG